MEPIGIKSVIPGKGFYTDGFSIELTGFREIYYALQKLPGAIREQIMQKAMREGLEIFLRAAKMKAPRGSGFYKDRPKGHMADAMYISRADWKFGVLTMGLRFRQNAGFNAHFIEFGTATFYKGTGRSVRKPYRIPKSLKGGPIAFVGKFSKYESMPVAGPSLKRFVTLGEGALKSGGSQFMILHHAYHPGIRPRPFIRPAFDENFQAVITKIGTTAGSMIEKEFEKRTLRKAA